MKRAMAWLPCLVLATLLSACAIDPGVESLNVSDLPKQDKEKSLLILLFDYDNGFYDTPDQEIEQYWSDLVFGTGSIEQETASINDYLKEISGGKFYYQPILLGNNETGVYSIHLDKNYSDEPGLNPNWPYQDFAWDMTTALRDMVDQGLDLEEFAAEGIDQWSYEDVLGNRWDGSTDKDNPDWHSTSTILAVYPGSGLENTDFFPLTTDIDSFSLVAHVNHHSTFGVIARELLRTLGTQSACSTGAYSSDWVSDPDREIPGVYNTVHIEPLYKIIYGWAKPALVTASSNVTLYPATSKKYRPVVIRTADDAQYYIVENRRAEGFDQGLASVVADGLDIWRVDRLGCQAIDPPGRTGVTLQTTMRSSDPFEVRRYVNSEDETDTSETLGGVVISIVDEKPDGSIVARIMFR